MRSSLKNGKQTTRIGIDEAGRGPLAGPLSVCALQILRKGVLKAFPTNCDSKKFSAAKREEFYSRILQEQKNGAINFSVILVPNTKIDRNGIEFATRFGIEKALQKLKVSPTNSIVSLDGRLKAPSQFVHQKTYIRGDSKKQEIGLASIVAKVTRDRYMKKIAKQYPKYGFEDHVGYGTLKHRGAIKKYGLSLIHRRTFCTQVFR
jgi:ribonuclease HII